MPPLISPVYIQSWTLNLQKRCPSLVLACAAAFSLWLSCQPYMTSYWEEENNQWGGIYLSSPAPPICMQTVAKCRKCLLPQANRSMTSSHCCFWHTKGSTGVLRMCFGKNMHMLLPCAQKYPNGFSKRAGQAQGFGYLDHWCQRCKPVAFSDQCIVCWKTQACIPSQPTKNSLIKQTECHCVALPSNLKANHCYYHSLCQL